MSALERLLDSSLTPTAWPVELGKAEVGSLERKLAEHELISETQSDLVAALTAPSAFETETTKTMVVMQQNVQNHQQLLDTLVAERMQLQTRVIQAEAALTETKKTNEAEKRDLRQLIEELRIQNAELRATVLSQGQKIEDLSTELTDLTTKFKTHQHYVDVAPWKVFRHPDGRHYATSVPNILFDSKDYFYK